MREFSFNSILVRLKVYSTASDAEAGATFQFHTGSIKREPAANVPLSADDCFNSILVRLKARHR